MAMDSIATRYIFRVTEARANPLPDALIAASGDVVAWAFGIHDRSPAAWVIVAAYLIAIACCVRAWRRDAAAARAARADVVERARFVPWFWLAVAVILVLLAVNKPLDLHDLLTDYGRRVARSGGWYKQRRTVQLAFALAVGAGTAAVLALVGLRLRPALGRYAVVLAGLWLLAVYVGLRVTSFHHVDAWFGTRMRGVKLHWIVELVAIAVIAGGAIIPAARTHRAPKD